MSVGKGGWGPGADSDPDGRVVRGVAGAEAAVWQDLVDHGEAGPGQRHIDGASVLLDALDAAGAGDRHDALAPGEQPSRASWETVMPLVGQVAELPAASTFFSKLPGYQQGSTSRMSVTSYSPAGLAEAAAER